MPGGEDHVAVADLVVLANCLRSRKVRLPEARVLDSRDLDLNVTIEECRTTAAKVAEGVACVLGVPRGLDQREERLR